MGLVGRLVGTPPDHVREKEKQQIVDIPEFDVTQYAKKLGVVVGLIVPVIITALKSFGVHDISTPIIVSGLGVTAVVLLSASLVMAVDLASRSYLKRGLIAQGERETHEDGAAGSAGGAVAVPSGVLVWLKDREEPQPLLAVARGSDGESSYLVAGGPVIQRRGSDGSPQYAFDGAPEWHPAADIHATTA